MNYIPYLLLLCLSLLQCAQTDSSANAHTSSTLSSQNESSVNDPESSSSLFISSEAVSSTIESALDSALDSTGISGTITPQSSETSLSSHTSSLEPISSESSEQSTPYTPQTIVATDARFSYEGLFNWKDSTAPYASWSGSTVRFTFTGTDLTIQMENTIPGVGDCLYNRYNLFVDDIKEPYIFTLSPTQSNLILTDIMGAPLNARTHTISITKRTEAYCGADAFKGIRYTGISESEPLSERSGSHLWFIGNSITCGYGIEGDETSGWSPDTENHTLSYGALTAQAFDAEALYTCWSGKGIYINYDKSTTENIHELFSRTNPLEDTQHRFEFPADLIVINLGTNDFAHGTPSESNYKENYLSVINTIHAALPQATFLLLDGPMMTGTNLNTLRSWKADIISTAQANTITISGFSLSPQGSVGFGGHSHPNTAQAEINAKELIEYIESEFGWQKILENSPTL
ncbi:MAG: GDSL-type esterase/lipase family protein [Fibrobacterales bacterium]